MGRMLVLVNNKEDKNALIAAILKRGVASERVKVLENKIKKEGRLTYNGPYQEKLGFLFKRACLTAVALSLFLHTLLIISANTFSFAISVLINVLCMIFGILTVFVSDFDYENDLEREINVNILKGKKVIYILYNNKIERQLIKNLATCFEGSKIVES